MKPNKYARLPYGARAEIAARLGFGRSYVSMVLRGHRHNQKIVDLADLMLSELHFEKL